MEAQMRTFTYAAVAALAVGSISTSAIAKNCRLTPECRASYEAEIAYWKGAARKKEVVTHKNVVKRKIRKEHVVVSSRPNVNTCVGSSVRESGFVSGFVYKDGVIIHEMHMMMEEGKIYRWCIPYKYWVRADQFWICKKSSSRYPNGRGKILRAHHMKTWHVQGYIEGVMDIKD